MTSWNRRVAAATRIREHTDPDAVTERLTALGLPAALDPDDATAVLTLVKVAETRAEGFSTTVLARVHDTGTPEPRLVKVAVIRDERGEGAVLVAEDDDLVVDPLTGLPGRDRLLAAIDEALAGLLRSEHAVGVFSIDVDRFKTVNDASGFRAGDAALRSLGVGLGDLLRPEDVLVRLGGDEFAVVCPDVLGPAEALALGERFRSVCTDAAPDSPLHGLTISVGIALGGPDRPAETLVRESETALYQAKGMGRDRCEVFDDALRSEVERRITVDLRLRRALDDEAIEVHYQPIVEIATNRIAGAEALLRIEGEDGEHLDPRELVEAAEDAGLIRRIEERVLERGARLFTALPSADVDDARWLSVNVSDRRLADSRFPLALARTLHHAELPAESLCLELGPSILEARAAGQRLLTQLRTLGVSVAVDDFEGKTDHPLFTPDGVELVKLRRDLVAAVGTPAGRTRAELVVTGLVGRGVDVCAVGVESEEQLEILHALGCRYAQGYLFSPPVDGTTLARFVEAELRAGPADGGGAAVQPPSS